MWVCVCVWVCQGYPDDVISLNQQPPTSPFSTPSTPTPTPTSTTKNVKRTTQSEKRNKGEEKEVVKEAVIEVVKEVEKEEELVLQLVYNYSIDKLDHGTCPAVVSELVSKLLVDVVMCRLGCGCVYNYGCGWFILL